MASAVSKSRVSLYAKRSYFEMIAEAEKPIAERRALPVGRGGSEAVQRRHHLLVSDIDQLGAAFRDGDKFPNPYNRACYHYLLETLKSLGAITTADKAKRVKFSTVYDRFKELTSDKSTKDGEGKTFWQRFKGRESRNEDTGRDEEGRLLQNLEVMQRVTGKNCYGIKVDQVAKAVLGLAGACIDILRGNGGEVLVTLNLNPQKFIELKANPNHLPVGYKADANGNVKVAEPTNELKRRRGAEAEAEGEEAPVKVVKAPKAKPAKKAPKVKTAEVEQVANVTPEPQADPVAVAEDTTSQPTPDAPAQSDAPATEPAETVA